MNKILIVDDEADIRFTFRTALEEGNHTVEASNGEEGLRLALQHQFDVILLDYRMPLRNGVEFLRALREAKNDTPVIMITAHGTLANAVEAMKLGAIDVLEKPVKPEPLRRLVDEVLRRHRSRVVAAPLRSPAEKMEEAKRLINLRQFGAAKTLLHEVFDYPDPGLHNFLGLIAEMEDNNAEAVERYKLALVMEPGHPGAQANLNRLASRLAE